MAPAPLAAQGTGVREASASDRGLIQLNTRVRYTTMVVLPDGEDILDVVCGDKDFWIISAAQNIAHVKPAKEGAATNMNLVAASGTVYSFLLNESKTTQPDLKVYVTADPSSASNKPQKYYSASQVSELQAQLTAAKAAVVTAQHQADEAVASFRRDYPASMQFVYGSPGLQEAVLRPLDLARRSVHVYPDRCARAAGTVRSQGRSTVAAQLPGLRAGRTSCPRCSTAGTSCSAKSDSNSGKDGSHGGDHPSAHHGDRQETRPSRCAPAAAANVAHGGPGARHARDHRA